MHTISVIIPTYNHGHCIVEALESVLAQTVQPTEVLVVDDGSTDDTRERLAQFRDPVRYLYHDNRGRGATRNRGIREARGNWLAFIDADDLWGKEKLERQMRLAGQDSRLDFICTDWCRFDENGVYLRVSAADNGYLKGVRRRETPDGWIFDESLFPVMIRDNFVHQSSVVMKRSLFESCGYYAEDLKRAQDRDLWMRVLRDARVAMATETLVHSRRHSLGDGPRTTEPLEYRLRALQRSLARGSQWEKTYAPELQWEIGRLHMQLGRMYLRGEAGGSNARRHLKGARRSGRRGMRVRLYEMVAWLPLPLRARLLRD